MRHFFEESNKEQCLGFLNVCIIYTYIYIHIYRNNQAIHLLMQCHVITL